MDISPRECSRGLMMTRGGTAEDSKCQAKYQEGCSGEHELRCADTSPSPSATKLSKPSHTSAGVQNQPSAKKPDGKASRKPVLQHTTL